MASASGSKVTFAPDGGLTCCKFPLSKDGKVRVGHVLAAFDASAIMFVDDDGKLSFLTENACGLSTDSFTAGATVEIRVKPWRSALNEQPCKRLKVKVSTRPLEDLVVDDSKLPFKGRDTLMVELAKRIGVYFDAFSDGRIKREDMLFVVFEGLAGVGKTRCLLETPKHVEKVVKSSSALAKLYACRAVYSVYITFNGTGVGGRTPHSFHSTFETIIRSRGPSDAGQCFMQACMISEIMYGRPWVELPPEYQQDIITEDVSSALMKMSTHIRNSKFFESQDLALYVLIDESQMLAQSIMRIGHDGLEFVKGMFLWISSAVMTYSNGQCLGQQCKLGLIPLIAGTVVPAVGRWGVSDWLPYRTVLPPLDKDSAADVLRELIDDSRFSEIMKGLVVLLEDCSYLPRLISYIYGAWVGVLKVPMSGKDFVHHLRETVFIQTKPWVDTLMSQSNIAVLKRMVRLCLTGAVMEEPQDLEKTECMKGYVYAEIVQDGWKYRSPRLLVRSLAEKLRIPARSVPLRPVAAKGSHLEDAFVDTFYALLCIYEGMQIPVAKLFVGAVGKQSILDMKVDIGRAVAQVDEKHQFFNPRRGRFHHEGDSFCIGTNECSYYLPPCTGREKSSLSVLFRCHKNAAVTDARLFLCDENGDFYEFWIQLKGGKDPMSQGDVAKCCQAAFDSKFKVDGRRKIYVLCTTGGFSFDESNITQDVLLMNLVHFLPDFMRLSPEE